MSVDVVWLLVFCALVVIAGVTSLNALTFLRLRSSALQAYPLVSVLVPARDEAQVIAETVRRILAQDYPSFELILLDDHSSDGTADLAKAAAGDDTRMLILAGQALPEGWTGKNWACWQLAGKAQGEILVFSDADVRWESGALTAIVAGMQATKADVFSVWPTQRSGSWGERLVVPLMMFAVLGYLPEVAVRFVPLSAFAAANGQCLAFRKEAYERVRGHFSVRNRVVEDVAMARLSKASGLRLVMALGSEMVWCRMYQCWREVRDGFAKNILAGHGHPLYLVASTLFHWLLFIVPWIWLLVGGWIDLGTGWPFAPLLLIGLGLGSRLLSAKVAGHRLVDAAFMPVSVFLMTIIAIQSLWWHAHGGPLWKGRKISQRGTDV